MRLQQACNWWVAGFVPVVHTKIIPHIRAINWLNNFALELHNGLLPTFMDQSCRKDRSTSLFASISGYGIPSWLQSCVLVILTMVKKYHKGFMDILYGWVGFVELTSHQRNAMGYWRRFEIYNPSPQCLVILNYVQMTRKKIEPAPNTTLYRYQDVWTKVNLICTSVGPMQIFFAVIGNEYGNSPTVIS